MSRISIKSGEEVFNSVRGHSARAFEPNKKNPILTQVQITVVPINAETHLVFATMVDAGKFYSYQIGCFPVTPRSEVKYAFILYSYDSNVILTDPFKNRTVKDILQAF